MARLKDVLSKLGGLYKRTGVDWHLHIYHCLTEPTCPTVAINPEGVEATRYRVDCDSIEQGVVEAVERVWREVMCGEDIGPMAPFSNHPDDARLLGWIAKWRRGERLDDSDFEGLE